jgi:hypothetical protein
MSFKTNSEKTGLLMGMYVDDGFSSYCCVAEVSLELGGFVTTFIALILLLGRDLRCACSLTFPRQSSCADTSILGWNSFENSRKRTPALETPKLEPYKVVFLKPWLLAADTSYYY